MIGERIELWHKEEYHYPAAHGFIPIMVSYIHEDELMHPAMLVVPGGGYRLVSPSEAHLVAMEFYPFSCRTAAYFIGSDRGLWIFSRRTSVCESVCAWSGYRGPG